MVSLVVLDAGPLVAFVDGRDQFHDWAIAQAKEVEGRAELITCEAVLAEAFFLVRHVPGGASAVLSFLEEGTLRLDFNLRSNLTEVAALMRKYHDVPMSLADACLVRMSELHSNARIFALDSDFRLYRRHGRQTIPLIHPA